MYFSKQVRKSGILYKFNNYSFFFVLNYICIDTRDNLIIIKVESVCMCVCVCMSYARPNKPTKLAENLREGLGGQGGCFKKNWEPAARRSRPPKSAAKLPRAAEDSPVSRLSKFLFEKVGAGMYYVHAKNTGCNPHPAAVAVETAPKPPRATKDGPVG